MAVENTTIARPYAEALFARAQETGKLDLWSDMLGFLVRIVKDPRVAGIAANPKVDRSTLVDLMLDIGDERLGDEGQNLVRLLVDNRRLIVLPEIAELFEALKDESQGTLEVCVTAPYSLNSGQERELAQALQKRLGREIRLTSNEDPALIGGVRIRAGDLVIDGTVQGQLRQLATELGI